MKARSGTRWPLIKRGAEARASETGRQVPGSARKGMTVHREEEPSPSGKGERIISVNMASAAEKGGGGGCFLSLRKKKGSLRFI